jgi:hypothetical protein
VRQGTRVMKRLGAALLALLTAALASAEVPYL